MTHTTASRSSAGAAEPAPRPASAPAPRPTSGLPFAGLSLDLPDTVPPPGGHFPFDNTPQDLALTVRLELAQALWEVGQTHTARALAEEVVEQAQGTLLQQAREWLAARA